MHPTPVIEQMELSQRDEVLAFLRRVWPENSRHGDGRFWDWHFPESPYCDREGLPIWLARIGGELVGQVAAVPVEYNVAGNVVTAAWIEDMIVAPEFRRLGVARNLTLAALDHYPIAFATPSSGQSSLRLFMSLGWSNVGSIPRYQRILNPGNAIREIARFGLLSRAVNQAFAPMRRRYPTSPFGTRLDGFDESFDELWMEARRQWPCSVSRTRAMLEWQFSKQPYKKFEILGCTDGGRLLGYAVMFFRAPNRYGVIEKAAISDICYALGDAEQTISVLLNEAVNLAIQRRVGTVVIDVMDSRVEASLRRAGFWKVRSDLQLVARVPGHEDLVSSQSNWYLTRADSDISIFESPNI